MRRPPDSIDRFMKISEKKAVEVRMEVQCDSVGGCHGQRVRNASGDWEDYLLVRAQGLGIARYHAHLTFINSSA